VWVSRVGRYRATIGLGMVIAAIASAMLASTASEPTVAAVAGLLGVVGVGVGMTIPASMSAAQNVVSHGELGLATALSKFARNFGGIVGLGVLGAVLQLRTFAALAPGMRGVLGESDDGFARELARDPSALLSEAPSLEHPALVEQPQRLDALLELLRAALADASALVLWGVALTLALAALLTLRSRDAALRSDFDASGGGP
jgi:MFS family permease